MRVPGSKHVLVASAAALLLSPSDVHAYVGPGGVISGIGALLALIAAVFAAFLGFFWFPVKRLLMWVRGRSAGAAELPAAPADPARK